jgi:ATPase subunit of ABC transporter with duplicated ATPase domains
MLLDEPTNNLDIDTIRWLETVLTERKCTMIIISHDRHFLNTVCTHMADLDYRELRVFPGNYDEYMTAATQAREQLFADNAKKKAQIADLQAFVSRFSANASKSRQATSRKRQIEKIELAEVKPSSRQSPYIRFEQDKKLYRLAVSLDKLSKSYGDHKVFRDVNLHVEAGDRVAVVGTNGIGKTTLLRSIMAELPVNHGTVKWAENAEVAYMPQDHAAAFEDPVTVFDWMRARGKSRDDDQAIRATLGRLLFSREEMLKTVDKLSGGERGRMLFGEIMLKRPNVILMDEPTNHLDMESIEALNLALENYPGTLVFVSHDREFVSSIATRIVEIKSTGIIDFRGTYDDYLRSRGIAIDLARAASQ